jgi:chaperonin GroEL
MSLGNKISKAIITAEKTTLIGGNGDGKHIEKLQELVKKEESAFKKEQIKKRISELTGGVAVITIGKNTDVERNEIMLKLEDAIKGTKSAYTMGVVVGAGLALNNISKIFENPKNEGETIMFTVCESPSKQLCLNSEVDDIEVDETVLDSVAVITSALKNAVSTATSICTIEAALVEIEEKL